MLLELLNAQRGLAAEVARAAGVSRPYIWQCASGARKLPAEVCPAIEQATKGRVNCEQLRPDVKWTRVADAEWPHVAGRPCIDPCGPAVEQAA